MGMRAISSPLREARRGAILNELRREDEFLPELYSKYHAQGLEIVALNFEEPEQLADPTRLKTLIQQYGIKY